MVRNVVFYLMLCTLISCNVIRQKQSDTPVVQYEQTQSESDGNEEMVQYAVIYKTVRDYSKYIPVTMNKEKTEIVSYPGITDVYFQGRLSLPDSLISGYWHDKRGINENSVFTDITYEEYVSLSVQPDKSYFEKRIIDKNPFIDIYLVKKRPENINEINYLNTIIREGFINARRIGPDRFFVK